MRPEQSLLHGQNKEWKGRNMMWMLNVLDKLYNDSFIGRKIEVYLFGILKSYKGVI